MKEINLETLPEFLEKYQTGEYVFHGINDVHEDGVIDVEKYAEEKIYVSDDFWYAAFMSVLQFVPDGNPRARVFYDEEGKLNTKISDSFVNSDAKITKGHVYIYNKSSTEPAEKRHEFVITPESLSNYVEVYLINPHIVIPNIRLYALE